MRDNDALNKMMGRIDPSAGVPTTMARADDLVPRQIMTMHHQSPQADNPHKPLSTLLGFGSILIVGMAAVMVVVFGPGWFGSSHRDPSASNSTPAAVAPANQLQLYLPADSPVPLTGCASAWSNWRESDVVYVDKSGETIAAVHHDPASESPDGQVWPTITVTADQDGSRQVKQAGGIGVWSSVGYPVTQLDERTVVVHGADGEVAATLTDLGPATPQVEVRAADGNLLGAVDYSAVGGEVNVVVRQSQISVGSAWENDPPVGRDGGPATTHLTLLWSSEHGVVLPSPTPDATRTLMPTPIVTESTGSETSPSAQVAPALGLVLSTPVGEATVGVFSSSSGTAVCAAIPDESGGFTYQLGYQSEYFDAAMAQASPDAVWYLDGGAWSYWQQLIPGDQSFIVGGLGADVTSLVVNLSDQTNAPALIEESYWLAVYPSNTADGRQIEPISVTATMADHTTETIGW